jgi:threonine synthase
MPPLASSLACAGCGAPPAGPDAVRCSHARAGDDVDHLLRRSLDPRRVAYPGTGEAHPFLRYRTLLHAYHAARARGADDAGWCAAVAGLDLELGRLAGRGAAPTPFAPCEALAERLGLRPGDLWIKDETGNVGGSHKARHLIAPLLGLELGAPPPGGAARLAIASCGNAALAAALLARAAGRQLDVFVPTWAHPGVVARLAELGARVVACSRPPGVAGDPCQRRFRAAVEEGAYPFCCQGPDNGLAIEGGATLAWEMLDALRDRPLDRLFVQVGGGALASACALGFADAVRLGRLARAPRLHAVQVAGCAPLVRAWDLLATGLLARLPGLPAFDPAQRGRAAARLAAELPPAAISEALRHAARHRSELMWPWTPEPASAATGILDDETHDWLAVVEAMLATGGWPIVVDETRIAAAHRLGRAASDIDVDPTGAAGLAGLCELLAAGESLAGERVAVLFTGVRRG